MFPKLAVFVERIYHRRISTPTIRDHDDDSLKFTRPFLTNILCIKYLRQDNVNSTEERLQAFPLIYYDGF
jgi:hypothetical protein